MKGAIQMQGIDKNEEEMKMNNRSLSKGSSLPKPSLIRQYNQNIMKTRSLSPEELEQLNAKDVEKGLGHNQ